MYTTIHIPKSDSDIPVRYLGSQPVSRAKPSSSEGIQFQMSIPKSRLEIRVAVRQAQSNPSQSARYDFDKLRPNQGSCPV
jgi:hypothetical protein